MVATWPSTPASVLAGRMGCGSWSLRVPAVYNHQCCDPSSESSLIPPTLATCQLLVALWSLSRPHPNSKFIWFQGAERKTIFDRCSNMIQSIHCIPKFYSVSSPLILHLNLVHLIGLHSLQDPCHDSPLLITTAPLKRAALLLVRNLDCLTSS